MRATVEVGNENDMQRQNMRATVEVGYEGESRQT
jgi:hypothetical protein